MMLHRAAAGITCALAAASLYGLIPNLVRASYANGIPPAESVFFRTSAIVVAFALLAVFRQQSFRVSREALPSLALQALATMVVSLGYLASVQFIPVGLAVIIFFTFPVIILLAAPLVEGEVPGLFRALVAVLAFAGLATAIGPSFETLDYRGVVLAALGGLGAASQFFSGRALSRHMTPSAFGAIVHAAIWPAILYATLASGTGKLQSLPGGAATWQGVACVAALAVIYVAAYMVQMMSLTFAPASLVAPYFNLEPVVTATIAAAALGERLLPNQYVGGGMVLGALAASSLAPAGRSQSQ
jgi:drug/metabolite transporter (DMT)-like permease